MSRLHHQSFHFGNRIVKTGKHGPGNNGMTDIQFAHLGHGGDYLYIVVMQPVAGVHVQAKALPQFDRLADALQFLLLLTTCSRVGKVACMYLDNGRTRLAGRFDLMGLGVDE
jgi:hypothetical protein